MHIVTSKKDLLRVVTRMAGIAEKKSTMPSLSCVLLRTEGASLTLVATDLYQTLVTSISADVAKPGLYAVPAKELLDRVRMMPDGPVELTASVVGLSIKSKGSARKFNMRGMPGEDFPPIQKADPDAPSFKLEAVALSRIIALTSFCVSTDETRANLNSLQVEWDGTTLRTVATDGHRLAKAETTVASSASASFLIPLKGIKEVQRMCEDVYATPAEDGTAATLTIVHSGPNAFFSAGGWTFSVKLVDATFPPWRQVIPQESPKTARAPRVALADAIKAVAVAASERTQGVKFALSAGRLLLSSESPDAGDGVDEVPVEYAGPNMAIGFNAQYVGAALAVLSSDEVLLGLNGELDPIVIRPTAGDSGDALFVVMPMRI